MALTNSINNPGAVVAGAAVSAADIQRVYQTYLPHTASSFVSSVSRLELDEVQKRFTLSLPFLVVAPSEAPGVSLKQQALL